MVDGAAEIKSQTTNNGAYPFFSNQPTEEEEEEE